MLSFLKQETDALSAEKLRLGKIRKTLERQSAELESRLYGNQPPPKAAPPQAPPKKIARFTPDPEELFWNEEKQKNQQERLKIEKRMARNRVIALSIVALFLLFWVGKILLF